MIDADILDWRVALNRLLPSTGKGLAQAKEELERSIHVLPAEAQPYYERLVRIAGLALTD